MAKLREVNISNLRRSLKTTLDTNEKLLVVTRKGTDVAVIMSPKCYEKIRELLKFGDMLAGQ